MDNSIHIIPKGVPYYALDVANAFKQLSEKQRLYAHYMLRASWAGFPICATQVSPESRPILQHLYLFFSTEPSLPLLRKKLEEQWSFFDGEEFESFLEYAAMVYCNGGNYLAFGDSKLIPSCKPSTVAELFKLAKVGLPEELLHQMFDISENKKVLDFPPGGVSGYYSSNVSKEDVLLANEYLSKKRIDGVNTRVFKDESTGELQIRIAAANVRALPAEEFRGHRISLYYGDFHEEMSRVVAELKQAKNWAGNARQKSMLDHYILHFETGDVNEHKESQRDWVRDVGPTVETNMGFIESYRDPSGVRSEWEGFVSIVNKAKSRKYRELVKAAEKFIPLLPWGREFEKDTFTQPDFTSLEILGFASSGIPAGICIPNYDDVRQSDGFKNVYLSNVVNAFSPEEKLPFLTRQDWQLFLHHFEDAISVNVGVHELLGHGTGKLFMQFENGTKNFDENTIDPISHQKVKSFYVPGDTFGTIFGGISSAYEECRAEAVALYLGTHPEVLEIFGVKTPEACRRTVHVLWLNMCRSGLVALEYYSPETQQWRQDHMRARFCILIALLRHNPVNPLVSIRKDPTEGLLVSIDENRIETDGFDAIEKLLLNLCVNKALANAARGTAYFEDLTTVSYEFVQHRKILMKYRKPRKQFVQPHTVRMPTTDESVPNEVKLTERPPSIQGVIEMMVARHSDIPL